MSASISDIIEKDHTPDPQISEDQAHLSEFEEIVFDHRSKAYGAYELRLLHDRHVRIGLLAALLILIFLGICPQYLYNWLRPSSEGVSVTNAIAYDPATLPQPESLAQKSTSVSDAKIVAPLKTLRVPEIVEKVDSTRRDSIPQNTSTASTEGNESGSATKGGGSGEIVEQLPSFPGGLERMNEYIRINTVYPESERDINRQGNVIISFVVHADGELSGFEVARSVSKALDQEALRVVESFPPWIPAMQHGKPVDNVLVRVTLSFRL